MSHLLENFVVRLTVTFPVFLGIGDTLIHWKIFFNIAKLLI